MFSVVELLYRVGLLVLHLSWVDIDLSHSTVWLVLLGQMGIDVTREAGNQLCVVAFLSH